MRDPDAPAVSRLGPLTQLRPTFLRAMLGGMIPWGIAAVVVVFGVTRWAAETEASRSLLIAVAAALACLLIPPAATAGLLAPPLALWYAVLDDVRGRPPGTHRDRWFTVALAALLPVAAVVLAAGI